MSDNDNDNGRGAGWWFGLTGLFYLVAMIAGCLFGGRDEVRPEPTVRQADEARQQRFSETKKAEAALKAKKKVEELRARPMGVTWRDLTPECIEFLSRDDLLHLKAQFTNAIRKSSRWKRNIAIETMEDLQENKAGNGFRWKAVVSLNDDCYSYMSYPGETLRLLERGGVYLATRQYKAGDKVQMFFNVDDRGYRYYFPDPDKRFKAGHGMFTEEFTNLLGDGGLFIQIDSPADKDFKAIGEVAAKFSVQISADDLIRRADKNAAARYDANVKELKSLRNAVARWASKGKLLSSLPDQAAGLMSATPKRR